MGSDFYGENGLPHQCAHWFAMTDGQISALYVPCGNLPICHCEPVTDVTGVAIRLLC